MGLVTIPSISIAEVEMKDYISKCTAKAKDAATSTRGALLSAGGFAKDSVKTIATTVLDQDGDGQFDQSDIKILSEKGAEITKSAMANIGKLAKEASRSRMAKDAATGATIGAAVAIPVPIIGPMAGAVVGAGIGVYKNVTGDSPVMQNQAVQGKVARDIYAELTKLDELRKNGIISDTEFDNQKGKLLDS